ncbi:MAG: 5'-deoxynucleotidase [Ruthenibacterium sp.]
MKYYAFNALLARMKYIARWGLMRSSRTESLSEHTADAAILAHTLCLVSVGLFGADVRPETVAVAALYHDAGEILTGDMPTPVKYKNDALRTAYKSLEKSAAASLAELLPDALQREMHAYLCAEQLSEKEAQLLKAADRLSALIKCIDEEQSGNREFAGAKQQQSAALHAMQCPEAEYFIEHMLPCYAWTLDELSQY